MKGPDDTCPGDVISAAYLEVSGLWDEPVVDELLRVFREAQHELSVDLQLVDGLNRLMDLQQTNNLKNTAELGYVQRGRELVRIL